MSNLRTLIFFLSFLVLQSASIKSMAEEEVEFQPHMIDHQNIGCPTNSHCAEKIGRDRKIWLDVLKEASNHPEKKALAALNRHLEEKGILFNFWMNSNTPNKDDLIFWDSNCEFHRKEGEEIFAAQAFVKSLTQDSRKKIQKEHGNELLFEEIFWKDSDGKITGVPVPRREVPLYFEGKNLIFARDEDGNYYHLAVSNKGAFSIVKGKKSGKRTHEVECPGDMVKAWNDKTAKSKRPWVDSYCKAIYDPEGKKSATLLIPYSCEM